jgi:hypothetical protein
MSRVGALRAGRSDRERGDPLDTGGVSRRRRLASYRRDAGTILEGAGLLGVTTLGVQTYIAAYNPAGPGLIAGVVRSLAPLIIRHGIANAEQLNVETLERRIAEEFERQTRSSFHRP